MKEDVVSAKIAKYLLGISAVKLNPKNPFVWTSGINSPIYCDNRVTLSYQEVRSYIKKCFAELILEKFPTANCIAGIATAGIAQGALIADVLDMPYIYIRPEPKKHGLKNSVEGRLPENANVVLIEDLVSTGKSSLAAIENLRNSGGNAIGLVSIFNYGFQKAFEAFEQANCPYYSLSNISVLLEEALGMKYITESQFSELKNWNIDPVIWSENFISQQANQ